MKKKLVVLGMALVILFLVNTFLGGAISKATAETPKRGGILNFALHYEPPHWDPHQTVSYRTQVYLTMTNSKITRDNHGADVGQYDFITVPDLAEKWDMISPTEVVFHIRKGVKFHNKPPVNGRELTSADIKYTFDRIFDPALKSPNKGTYEVIDRIETPDRYTFKVILKEPFAPFVKYTGLTYAMVVAKEVVDQFGDLKKWESAIGTGPFMLEKYVPNEGCRFVRHPEYFEKGRPYLDEVNWRIIPKREVILAAFRTKQLDMNTGYIEYEDLMEMIKKNPDQKWSVHHSNSWARLTFNTSKPPFNDKRVRQAASMCIDRNLQNQITYDGRAAMDQVIPRAMWGSLPLDQLGEASKYFLPNKEEAKKLVEAAGHKTPLEVRLAYTPAYGEAWNSTAEALFGQLNSSGVFKLKVISKEYGAYVSTNYVGNYDEECFYALTTPPSDADEVLYDMYHSTSGRNSCKVKDPHLDKLLETQRRELDEGKRLAMLKDIQYYLADQMYICPMIAGPVYDTWYPYVKNYARRVVPAYNVGDNFLVVWLDK